MTEFFCAHASILSVLVFHAVTNCMYWLVSLCEGYECITHHDVSVTWWNEFARYAFSSDHQCKAISSLFQKLLFQDIKGPSIPNDIDLPPIVQHIVDPSLVVKPARETCRNYDVQTINLALKSSHFGVSKQGSSHDDDPFLMSYINDDDESLDFGPCNTQQETNTYGTDDCLLVFPAVDDSHEVTMNHSPYSVLFPLLKELTSILEGNCSVDRLLHYKDMLSNAIVNEKRELLERSKGSSSGQPCGKMVSSGVQSNKRHRSHGTRHM